MTKERALEMVGYWISDDGGFYCLGEYVGWTPGNDKVVLDGRFTVEQLEAIAWYVRHYEELDKT